MNKIKISILCPTRQRMSHMRRLAESAFDTCYDRNQVEIVFGIDDDDHESIEVAKELQKQYSPENIVYTTWPRRKYIFSDLINQVAYVAKGEIFNLVGDDAVYITKGWDRLIVEQYALIPDGIALVHVQDGITGEVARDLVCHPFMHRNWLDAVGYLLPPIFNGDWADWWITRVAAIIDAICKSRHTRAHPRKVYRPDILIQHMHIESGLADPDKTYYEHLEERRADTEIPDKDHPYHSVSSAIQREQDVFKLLNFLENFYREKYAKSK